MRRLRPLEIFELNDGVLSRTAASGLIDGTVGSAKRAVNLDCATVSKLIDRNRAAAAEYVCWRARVPELSPFDCRCSLIALSEIVNCGISRNGILRTWSISGRQYGEETDISPDQIPERLFQLDISGVEEVLKEPAEKRLAVVAELEWEIGIGPLHPFADGCGRTSRYFSALMSVIYDSPAVVHSSRTAYYDAGSAGRTAFKSYYGGLERVEVVLL